MKKNETIIFRVSKIDKQLIKDQAEKQRLSVGSYIRHVITSKLTPNINGA